MLWSMGAVYNCTWVLNTLPQVYHGSLGVIVVINKPWDLIVYIERKPWENEPYKPQQKQDGRLESAFYIVLFGQLQAIIQSIIQSIITLACSMRYMPYATHHVYSLLKIENAAFLSFCDRPIQPLAQGPVDLKSYWPPSKSTGPQFFQTT